METDHKSWGKVITLILSDCLVCNFPVCPHRKSLLLHPGFKVVYTYNPFAKLIYTFP